MLKRVLVGVVFVPLIVLLVLFAPPLAFACFVALLALCASWELIRATAELPGRMHVYTCVAAAAIPLGVYAGPDVAAVVLGVAALALLVLTALEAILSYGREGAVSYEGMLKCLFAGVFMPALLSALVGLMGYGAQGHGRMYALLTIGLAFITDGGAYFAGMLLGRHRGITRVSPNKSVEGYVGGLVTAVLFTLIYGLALQFGKGFSVRYLPLAVYGLIGGLVTEVGDLAFSMIKREYGIKDFGKVLPGHGGIMDRFDSMVFCAPAILLLSSCWPGF